MGGVGWTEDVGEEMKGWRTGRLWPHPLRLKHIFLNTKNVFCQLSEDAVYVTALRRPRGAKELREKGAGYVLA